MGLLFGPTESEYDSIIYLCQNQMWSKGYSTNEAGRSWRQTELLTPKFEFKCYGVKGESKTFSLKNISPVYVSEINVEAFDLVYLDGDRQNLILSDIDMPTSLEPGKSEEFTYKHRCFERRGVGYKEFWFVFNAIDQYSNKLRCVITKTVDNPYDKKYMLGEWNAHTEWLNLHNSITEEGRIVVLNSVSISGNAQNVQIQQGSDNSTQSQNPKTDIDFDAAQKVIDEILKYQPRFEEEFGDRSKEIIDAINEAKDSISKKDQGRLKSAWNWIKSVAANATGGMLAMGIPALLDQVNIL